MKRVLMAAIAAAVCALCACGVKETQPQADIPTGEPASAEQGATDSPTASPTENPAPTVCPGQHGDLKIVLEGENGEWYEISALGRMISRSTSHADGSTMEEADGCTLPYCYGDVCDQLPAIKTDASISISPPDWPGYERDPVEKITAYTENAEGSLEEFREFEDISALERFINAEWDAHEELIFEIIVRYTDRYYSNGSLSTGLDGWSFKLIPFGAEAGADPAYSREDFLILTDNGQRVTPFICPLNSTKYVEPTGDSSGGFLHGDSMEFFNPRMRVEGDLPIVSRTFEYAPGEDCRVTLINVFDRETLEQTHRNITRAQLDELIESSPDGLIVELWVTHTGRYIEAEDDNEYETFSYAFIAE